VRVAISSIKTGPSQGPVGNALNAGFIPIANVVAPSPGALPIGFFVLWFHHGARHFNEQALQRQAESVEQDFGADVSSLKCSHFSVKRLTIACHGRPESTARHFTNHRLIVVSLRDGFHSCD
jgi:hypothetical protein